MDKNGIDYTVVTADEMNKPGVYIVSYWEPYRFGLYSIHTIAIRYDGTNYTGHNPNEKVYPSSWGRLYIYGYYLGE